MTNIDDGLTASKRTSQDTAGNVDADPDYSHHAPGVIRADRVRLPIDARSCHSAEEHVGRGRRAGLHMSDLAM